MIYKIWLQNYRLLMIFYCMLPWPSVQAAEPHGETVPEIDTFQELTLKQLEALKITDPRRVLKMIDKALSGPHSPDDEKRLALHLLAAEVLIRVNRLSEVPPHLQQLERLLDPWVHTDDYMKMKLVSARLLIERQKFIRAFELISETYDLAQAENAVSIIAEAGFLYGVVLYYQEEFDRALQFFNEAEALAEENKDDSLIIQIHKALANNARELGLTQKAKDHNQKAIDRALEVHDKYLLVSLYLDRAWLFVSQKEFEISNDPLTKAFRLSKQLDDIKIEGQLLLRLSEHFFEKSELENANIHAMAAINSTKDSEYQFEYYSALKLLGMINLRQGNIEESKKNIQEAKKGFEVLQRSKESMETLPILAEIHEKQKNYHLSNALLKEYQKRKFAILDAYLKQSVIEVQAFYQSQKKEKQIQLLNKDNQLKALTINKQKLEQHLIVGMLVIMFVFVAMLLFWLKWIRLRNVELKHLNDELKDMTVRDPLTMLYNRRYLKETADNLIANCQRRFERDENDESFLGFIMLDIDNFKRLNDYYSHELGDFVLKQIAEDLKKDCREGDAVIRWGGEEFLIIVNDTNFDRLEKFCARLLNERNQREISYQQMKHRVPCSLGYVLFPFDGQFKTQFTWEETVRLADICLHKAKLAGRNRAFGLECVDRTQDIKYGLFNDVQDVVDQGYVKMHAIEGAVVL